MSLPYLGVLLRPQQAHLLGGPEDGAQGSLRHQTELFYHRQRPPADERPGAVVHRPLADVPGVEVAADEDHLLRVTAPDQLADGISRGARLWGEGVLRVQADDDVL